MKYLVGNWKSNKNFEETYTWFDQFAASYRPVVDLTVVLAVPFPFIVEAKKKVTELNLQQVAVAAQDVSPFPYGSYTGAVSAQMLSAYIDYVIVGHSERRNHFAESHLEIANKIYQAHQAEITPILCVDEPYVQKQLAVIENEDLSDLIIAYEPLSAIGTGEPDDPKHIVQVVKKIKQILDNKSVPIIYGGSTNDQNASTFLKIDGIDGLLPGGSSLNPETFSNMTHAFT